MMAGPASVSTPAWTGSEMVLKRVIASTGYERMCDACVIPVTLGFAHGACRGRYFLPVSRRRADSVVAERGLARSRASAAEAIRAGRVRIGTDGATIAKPSELIDPGAELVVAGGREFVSRGGIKLANALDALGVDVAGRDCLDVGASTGGFTDCLLRRGAARVIALDVAP